ncbi:MAG TPA: hypothetical protein VH044_05610 [Polyangiaceae bacterium]|jgi:hypothetical protein|nr:hypothetical protein [Polyangiaceae bacterium]
MANEHLSDDALERLQRGLARFEPKDVRGALDSVDIQNRSKTLNGASGPLDFGSIEPGVLVYRDESGTLCMRVTVSDMTGATYDELELSDAEFERLARSVIDRLERTNAPHSR